MSGREMLLAGVLIAALAPAGAGAHTLGDAADGHHHSSQPDHATADHEPALDAVDAARSLVDAYRRQGDDALLAQAGRLLGPPLAARPSDPRARLVAAWVAQAEHRFDDALAHLDVVLGAQPDNGEAWLLRAGLALVTGDRAQAAAACRSASALMPPAVTVACLSRVRGMGAGRAASADAYAVFARVLAVQTTADPELDAWLQETAGDLAIRAGDAAAAAGHYRAALDRLPTLRVRAALAEVLLASGQPSAALDLIDGDAHVAPALVIRRMLALQALGQGPDPAEVARIDARFQGWIAADELQHAREMALFYLTMQPDAALARTLAERNLDAQREPEDVALACRAGVAAVAADGVCSRVVWPLLPG
ncbi:MAG: hypothetical protein RIB46_14750 [Pseudomonadales bacterium]